VSGIGQYASVGDATAAVKKAVHTVAASALAAAGEDEVDVRLGFVWPAQWDDTVAVTAVRTAPRDGTVSPTRRRQMDVFQDVSIVAFRVTDDEGLVHDRAYHLLDVIDQAMRHDPTLGGAALWCFSDELTSDGATDETDAGEGRLCEIAVTFAARVIVTG